jgi:hypothetical protein
MMSSKPLTDKAEAVDDFIGRVAIIMIVMSVNFTLTAWQYVASEAAGEIIDKIQMVSLLLAGAWIMPSFLRLKMSGANEMFTSDSYIASVFKKAAVKAFSLTYLFLVVAEIAARADWLNVPSEFYLSGALAFTTATFSVAFFFFSHSEDYVG